MAFGCAVLAGVSSSKKFSGGNSGDKPKNQPKTIYFDLNASTRGGETHVFHNDELAQRLRSLINTSERIWEICVWSNNIGASQVDAPAFFHAFVVVRTNTWWWSFERCGEGATIQRAKDLGDVAMSYRQQQRNAPKEIINDNGIGTMDDLVEFLYVEDLVGSSYCMIENNCKDFAKKVFNTFSKTKKWNKLRLNVLGFQFSM